MILSYKFNVSASVDKTIINKFLPEHLESMKSLINLEAYSTLYGDNFKTIYFDGFHIIDTDKINLVLLKRIGSPIYKLQFDAKKINLFLGKELIK